MLTDLWLRDAYSGDTVAKMPWILDGIDFEEITWLQVLDSFSAIDVGLGTGLVDSLWVADGLSEDEFALVVEKLFFTASEDTDLAVQLLAAPWAADGLNDAERTAFEVLLEAGSDHRELTVLLAASSWVADGAGLDEPDMGEIFVHFLEVAGKDTETAGLAATAPWVVDGVTRGEARIIGFLAEYLDDLPEESKSLLDLPQEVSGLSVDDRLLYDLVPVAFWNRPVALTVARFAAGTTGDISDYLFESLLSLAEVDLALLEQLAGQPWFADGLDANEAALLVTLDNVALKNLDLYKQLLDSHYVQHREITLRLAGGVNVWVVQSDSLSTDEGLLKTIEDTARISEQLLQTPFPTTDIILLVIPPKRGLIGEHRGSHMVLLRSGGNVAGVSHETANYYFTTGVGPIWLSEGAAEFMKAYVNHRKDLQTLDVRRAVLLRDSNCFDEIGIENIRHFNYYLGQSDRPGWEGCAYALGENFLLGLYDTIGRVAFVEALTDLYLSEPGSELPAGDPRVEEWVYNILLENTPADKQEEFRDLYRMLHGGQHAFPDTDFSDGHGDQPAAASTIAVGKSVKGDLDYIFDFDYFKFKAEEGVKYRIDVGHTKLGKAGVTLFGPDGQTEEKWNWKSRRVTSLGPRIIWVAPSSEDYYLAVQNFGGQTGAYTLTVTKVADVDDDHGDTIATATYASLGEVVEGIVDDEFDFDYFRFRVVGGSQYQIRVEGDTLKYFRVRLYTLDGAPPEDWAGNQFAEDSVSGETTKWVAPGTGEYYLALDGFNDNLGSYTFQISTITTPGG